MLMQTAIAHDVVVESHDAVGAYNSRFQFAGDCSANHFSLTLEQERIVVTMKGEKKAGYNADISATPFGKDFLSDNYVGQFGAQCLSPKVVRYSYYGFRVVSANTQQPIKFALTIGANGTVEAYTGITEDRDGALFHVLTHRRPLAIQAR